MQKPETWDDFEALAQDFTKLEAALRVRLVEIAFGNGGSAQCRAIETLIGMPAVAGDDDIAEGEHDGLESLALRYLQSRGFVVSRPADISADKS